MRPTLQPLQPTHAALLRVTARNVRACFVAALVLATAIFVAVASAPALAPAATLASKRAQAAKLDAEVSKLENRYDDLQERFRGAQWELEKIRGEVKQAHGVVVATRRDRGVATDRLVGRATAIYRTGGASGDLAELATAGSFTTFFERVDTLRRVGNQDATVLDRVQALNRKVEQKETQLKQARTNAAAAARRARADEQRMEAILTERKQKLDSVTSDIRAIM
ncbi:MAG: hypothetical protein ABI200_07390, partial [Gaiellales bacterium]